MYYSKKFQYPSILKRHLKLKNMCSKQIASDRVSPTCDQVSPANDQIVFGLVKKIWCLFG